MCLVIIGVWAETANGEERICNEKSLGELSACYYTIWMSLVTGLFFLVLLLNQR